jgi:hypothetical protein
VPMVPHRAAPTVVGFKNGAGFGDALHRRGTIRAATPQSLRAV